MEPKGFYLNMMEPDGPNRNVIKKVNDKKYININNDIMEIAPELDIATVHHIYQVLKDQYGFTYSMLMDINEHIQGPTDKGG